MPSRLAVVRSVASALGPARTEDDVARAVLDAVAEHLGAVTAVVWLLSPDGSELRLAHERNVDRQAAARFARLGIDEPLPGPAVVRTGEACFIGSRAERDECWPGLAGAPTLSDAVAVLPLTVAGDRLGVMSIGFPQPRVFDSADRTALLAVADQCAIALDRARLYAAARADAAANHLLARISGEHLGDWIDLARQAASACVEDFVDSCAVYVREGSVVRRVAIASRSEPELAAQLTDRYPTPVGSPAPNAVAIRTGRAVRVPPLTEHVVATVSSSPVFRERVREARVGDAWVLPLTDGTRTFGAMLFAAAPGEELDAAALALAQQVAERTARTLRSASVFAQHRAAVEALHDVLLPADVPSVDGLEVAACYVPFGDAGDVGGDWWDVLPLPGELVGIAVGDVAGHGVPAATVMGQLRNTLRARLVVGVEPPGTLDELSRFLDWTFPRAHATAVVGVVDPATGLLRWSSAGHPPPLVVSAAGEPRFLGEEAGLPLGVLPRRETRGYAEHRTTLDEGDVIYLYTDGLVEGRERPIDDGLAELARAAATPTASSLQAFCEQLVSALVQRPEDDVCLLAVRRLAT